MDNKNQIDILKEMLSQIKFDDPKFRLFIQQEIIENGKRRKQREVTKEILRRLRIQNKKLMEQVASFKEQLKRIKEEKNKMVTEMNHLTKLNNSISDALGSCNACWGEDPNCEHCAGNGSSCWRNINKRLFNMYVLPVLEKLYGLSNKLK